MTNSNAPHIDRSGRVDPRPKRHTPVEFLTSGHPMPTEMHRPSIAALDEAAKRTGWHDWRNVTLLFMSGSPQRMAVIAHAWTIELAQ